MVRARLLGSGGSSQRLVGAAAVAAGGCIGAGLSLSASPAQAACVCGHTPPFEMDKSRYDQSGDPSRRALMAVRYF